METITSQQNPHFKLALKLSQSKRERNKSGLTLLDGSHLILAWLDAGRAIQTLLLTERGTQKPEIATILARTNAKKLILSDELFEALSELPSATGILAQVQIPHPPVPQLHGRCLLLDGVQDPGNVGAILRTAYAAGVEQVWLSAACPDIWSPKVLRAGMGAQVVLPCIENADLLQLAAQYSGKIIATLLDQNAIDLYASDLRGDVALVVGSEGQGVSTELAAMCSLKVLIPMQLGIESLNVGHAAAICLYEIYRQNN
ncbi:RNA methyltransferase [Chitinibacter fontanus]|uniref:RNA methyltransferase n=1 Tax=Chitinibacter fontanus TaxID=1737446 RepID=A0A7D5V7J4_9NEIS|nr:RNA methyltransferase [Chitinibacter fontanus]QLI80074.1 RNA methyltransferase [Chitinibacter fontanus]